MWRQRTVECIGGSSSVVMSETIRIRRISSRASCHTATLTTLQALRLMSCIERREEFERLEKGNDHPEFPIRAATASSATTISPVAWVCGLIVAALFPPWTNTATRVVLLVVGGALVGLLATPMIYARSPFATGQGNPLLQPVPFDHRHHVRDDGIDCLYCHGAAEWAPYAGVPATEVCLGCHNQIWNDSPLLALVRDSVATDRPIAWQRVHSLPDFVYFDHSIHVNKGIGCVSCHGRVDEMAAVYQLAPLTMGWCLDCHRDPEPNLRPRDQITSMTWQAAQPGLAAELAVRYGTRHLTHCSTCHR